MKIKLFFLLFVLFHFSFSQWSTSTNVDSALYVCPGFEPGILSLEDGSCYIAGGLNDYLYVQKLDPQGYKLWPQSVQVFATPGTDNLGYFKMVSDGLGGLLFVWKDYRGAYVGPDDYYNNAVYMQRVDKDGNILWQQNGIQIAPVDGGNKEANIVSDGNGGAIVMLGESDFQKPGAAHKERTWIQHYDNTGTMEWSFPLDSSSTAFSIYPPAGVDRLGPIVRFRTSAGIRFISIDGDSIDTLKYNSMGNVYRIINDGAFELNYLGGRSDSAGNTYMRIRITKLSNNWDSLWAYDYERIYEPAFQYGYVANNVLSDGNDGIYFAFSFENLIGDRISYIQNIQRNGPRWESHGFNGLKFSPVTIQSLFAGKSEVGAYFGNGTSQKYDTTGQPMWQEPVVIFSNPSNAYFKIFASDNNGGCIIAFWTTAGGIYAQHTGRDGKVGIVTSVDCHNNNTIPSQYGISQNYPNPFNPTTSFNVQISHKANVSIKIYDLLGREIDSMVNTTLESGAYTTQWNASKVTTGVYFYTLEVDGKRVAVRKMLLTK